jgi:hypothetical protein
LLGKKQPNSVNVHEIPGLPYLVDGAYAALAVSKMAVPKVFETYPRVGFAWIYKHRCVLRHIRTTVITDLIRKMGAALTV